MLKHDVQHRDQEDPEQRCGEHAAEHRGADSATTQHSRAGRDHRTDRTVVQIQMLVQAALKIPRARVRTAEEPQQVAGAQWPIPVLERLAAATPLAECGDPVLELGDLALVARRRDRAPRLGLERDLADAARPPGVRAGADLVVSARG